MNTSFTPATPMATLVSMFSGYPEHMAVVNDDIGALDAALAATDDGLDVRHHDVQKHTPLALAICLHRSAMVEHLIRCGASVDLADARDTAYDKRPVVLAARHGTGAIMSMLVKAGASLNFMMAYELPLCHIAAANTDATVLRVLLDAGVPCDARHHGELPLHVAARNANEQLFSMLLDAEGLELDGEDHRNVANFAAQNRNEKLVQILIAAGVKMTLGDTAANNCPIHFAAQNANVAVVRSLIEAGVDVNVANDCDETPVYFACSNPNVEVLDALLAAGAEWRSPPHSSVCHAAARNRNDAIMLRVIESGIDVSAGGSFGRSLMFLASGMSTANVLSLLLDVGAAQNGAIDQLAMTTCLNACGNANAGVMRALIAAGAPFGVTVLQKAICHSNLDAVRALIDAGIDVAHELNTTPLWTMHSMSGEIVEFLIRQGVNFRARDDDGHSVCHFASTSCLAVLFARGADLNLADNSGKTPLLVADGDELITLIAAGADAASVRAFRHVGLFAAPFLAAIEHASVAVDSVPWRQVAWACNRITERQFELLRLRAFQVCVGLQDRQLPALVSCEILAHVFAPLESLVAFHRVWAIVTAIKHFLKKKDEHHVSTSQT